MRIKNPNGPNSELLVTRRPHGGVSIKQGPVYILISADEVEPLVSAIRQENQ